jgi:aminoglycoside phosphotransferase (APT) family kinase protein
MPEGAGSGGRRLLGQGREAEIFEWDDGTVLRLLRSPGGSERVEREAAAMRAAANAGVDVPAVHGTTTVDGRAGLVMGRVDGPDLITSMGRRPWTLFRAARIVGSTQARLHDAVAPPELPSLREHTRSKIGAAADLPRGLAEFALAELDALPDGDRLCHGDLHPANVLLGRDRPAVIDWTNATRGDPAGDVARTRLLLRVGAVEEHMPALVLRLQAYGRGMFYRRYGRAYENARPIDDDLVNRWEIVRAADRFSEPIPEERPALLKMLEERATRRA